MHESSESAISFFWSIWMFLEFIVFNQNKNYNEYSLMIWKVQKLHRILGTLLVDGLIKMIAINVIVHYAC